MNHLNSMTLSLLDTHIKKLVFSERQVTDQILKAIIELDARRGYAELGFSSLFTYLTLGVGYSESSAQRRIVAARLMAKVSEPIKETLRGKLKAGIINLSQLSKVGSLIQNMEQKKTSEDINACVQKTISTNALVENLLPQIENKDLAKTESIIADLTQNLYPELNRDKSEKAKVRNEAGGIVTITLRLTRKQNEKLQKVLAKKSHAIPDGDINILIEMLLDKELKGYDVQIESASLYTTGKNAIKKTVAEPALETTEGETAETAPQITDGGAAEIAPVTTFRGVTEAAPVKTPISNKKSKSRKYISIKIKRRVLAKAEHRCQYISPITGERCQETKYLTLDHIIPLVLGGTDDEHNLQCYCFCHNLSEARRMGISRKENSLEKLRN